MNISYEFETIAAIATPLGMGGVGIVRISGEKAFEIVQKIFQGKIFVPGRICHGWITENGKKIDEVVVLPFRHPHSYTGEDVVEIQGHGGLKVVNKILELVLKNGARMAQKGEFTKRAFLNHRMDLSQAEAVLDLIHAKTDNFAQKSANNLSGALTDEINKIKQNIFDLMSRIIAAVDFPDEVMEPSYGSLNDGILASIKRIENVLDGAKNSNIMRQGIKVAIAGCPNAGKSSLFNSLLNLERAIVTEIPGTTRDIIQETLDIDGIPVTLIDTAGIRDDAEIDKVEAIGIDYTKKCVNEADLILFLFDSSVGMTENDRKIFEIIKEKPYIKIASKADIAGQKIEDALYISSKRGENINELKKRIREVVLDKNSVESDFTTNKRQEECLFNAKLALENALLATEKGELQDLISIDIKSALIALGEVTGEVITDDILNNIFDNFCIGK